jgi:hypothetical protein
MTSRFLFKDRKLNIAICSGVCEHKFIESLDANNGARVLSYLDGKVEKTRRHEKAGWTAAGSGLLMVAAGFLIPSIELFMAGVFPLTVGALSTRYFEDRIYKLTRTRKRIAI